MPKPHIHAKSSAKKFGGKPEDYTRFHDFMDSSKFAHADVRHRAIFHSAFGCYMIEKVFGSTFINSDGDEVSVRDVAEQHIIEDLGYIPSLSEWLSSMKLETWMGGPTERDDDGIVVIGAVQEKKKGVAAFFEGIKEHKKAVEDEVKQNGRKFFEELFDEIFNKNPDLLAVKWVQFTPYFNDGDPCEFTVWDFYFRLTTTTLNEDYDDDGGEMWENTIYKFDVDKNPTLKRKYELCQAIADTIYADNDIMLFVFGDHAEVIVTRKNESIIFEVCEHQHD